jgi:hypothetical protein
MVTHRTVKKAGYAAGFFVVVISVGTLIVLPWLPSRQQVLITDTGSSYVPVAIENVVVIPHIAKPGPKGKTIDLVARVKNENPRAGTGSYPVTFTVQDTEGEVISRFTQDAYVLPGGLQYLVALDVPIPSDKTLGKIEAATPRSITLTPLPDNARLPDFSVFLRDRIQVMSGAYPLEQQRGIVTNNSTFDWEKVEVTGIALDDKGAMIGVGKTFVGKLLIGEQREFTLQWPFPDDATVRVIALATTNIYSDANIVHLIGDPGKLR